MKVILLALSALLLASPAPGYGRRLVVADRKNLPRGAFGVAFITLLRSALAWPLQRVGLLTGAF
jgi:hypothetical protein